MCMAAVFRAHPWYLYRGVDAVFTASAVHKGATSICSAPMVHACRHAFVGMHVGMRVGMRVGTCVDVVQTCA